MPKSFGENLNAWFRSLAESWQSLVIVSLLVHIPLAIVVTVVFWLTGAAESFALYLEPESLESLTDAELLERLVPVLWTSGVWSILQVLAGVFVVLGVTRAVVSAAAGVELTWREVSRHALSRTAVAIVSAVVVFVAVAVISAAVFGVGWAIFGTTGVSFMTVFLTTVVALTALVVMAWLGVSVSLANQVISTERTGPILALTRSFSLIRGRWWITLGFLAVTGIIAAAASQAASLVLSPLFFAGVLVPGALALAFGTSAILQGLLVAATSAAYAVWYVDLRARKERLQAEQLI